MEKLTIDSNYQTTISWLRDKAAKIAKYIFSIAVKDDDLYEQIVDELRILKKEYSNSLVMHRSVASTHPDEHKNDHTFDIKYEKECLKKIISCLQGIIPNMNLVSILSESILKKIFYKGVNHPKR